MTVANMITPLFTESSINYMDLVVLSVSYLGVLERFSARVWSSIFIAENTSLSIALTHPYKISSLFYISQNYPAP